MMRPLPKEIEEALKKYKENTSILQKNTGLWYDKFCDQWEEDFFSLKEGGKIKWIREVVNAPYADQADLKALTNRIYDFIKNNKGTPLFFKLISPFVTGLGRDHPIENGFAWHHTRGVPYLPGTSVKGMVRAWAREWAPGKVDEDAIKRILGYQSKKISGVGSVIFLDALPTQPVQLKADVMTPHYDPYYKEKLEQLDENPPADWYSPIPIPFLVVAPGSTFQFGVIPRNHDSEQDQQDCKTAKQWLQDALKWIGAGAKTAVGYGRFSRDTDAEEQALKEYRKRMKKKQEEKELQGLLRGKSSIAQKLIKQAVCEKWTTDKNAFSKDQVIENWLEQLEQDPQPDAMDYLSNLIKKHFPGLLENPDATKGKRKKYKFNDRQREFAKRLLNLPKPNR